MPKVESSKNKLKMKNVKKRVSNQKLKTLLNKEILRSKINERTLTKIWYKNGIFLLKFKPNPVRK